MNGWLLLVFGLLPGRAGQFVGKPAEIRVVDAATGRGIPCAELETTHSQFFVTDNAGRVAFDEPGLMGQEVFFNLRCHGYEIPKDGLGIPGQRLTPRPGEIATIQLKRIQPAERLCRLTGEGRFRDSELLGHAVPDFAKANQGKVAGQDSVQAIEYRGKLRWFWGDTLRISYPLGLFHTAGATTPLPGPDLDPSLGIPFQYFTGQDGFARAMMPYTKKSPVLVWVFSLGVVPDSEGRERLVTHYTVRKDLANEYEHGVAVYNDEKDIFESVTVLPAGEKWRHPTGHPIPWEQDGKKWLLMGSPNPNVRVPATLEAVLDPKQYEAFTCAEGVKDGKPTGPKVDPAGKPVWRWSKDLPPIDSATEVQWVKEGKIRPADARFCPTDVAGEEKGHILLHNGTVRWNQHRQRWVLLAGQVMGGPSFLGEVWYAEAKEPTGPFTRAARVVTHQKQSLYNVCHHPFLDREGGRFVHFEGTYTNDFSGNPWKTPRYNYNQMLHRLDLDHEAVRKARVE
jgi:hypothetical protein